VKRLFGLNRMSLVSVALMAAFFVSSTAGANAATTSKSLTQAQKLSKALKACKKQPTKRKRAACVKRARKKYAPHHAVASLPGTVTTPAAPAPPVAPAAAVPPAAPKPPPTGQGAPEGPTLQQLERRLRELAPTFLVNLRIENVIILRRGEPHLGTVPEKVLATTWIYPLEYEYDEIYYESQAVPEETEHLRLGPQFELNNEGVWRGPVPSTSGGTPTTCEAFPTPHPNWCK
jgi:hypothetical protein